MFTLTAIAKNNKAMKKLLGTVAMYVNKNNWAFIVSDSVLSVEFWAPLLRNGLFGCCDPFPILQAH